MYEGTTGEDIYLAIEKHKRITDRLFELDRKLNLISFDLYQAEQALDTDKYPDGAKQCLEYGQKHFLEAQELLDELRKEIAG